jgi:hypothetical protein
MKEEGLAALADNLLLRAKSSASMTARVWAKLEYLCLDFGDMSSTGALTAFAGSGHAGLLAKTGESPNQLQMGGDALAKKSRYQ